MSFPHASRQTVPFRSMIRASGYAEVWNESNKFNQYGWKCATYEDQYSNDTLIGNWNEERFDIKKLVQRKPLPSQYAHYYQTTYSSAYNKEDRLRPLQTSAGPYAIWEGSLQAEDGRGLLEKMLSFLVPLVKREPHAFPAHQPELNPPETKKPPNSCQKVDYINPAFHRLPLSPAPKKAEANECKEQGSEKQGYEERVAASQMLRDIF
ncbi:UPF0686 protein C11orf1 homolog [Latimeria chalumnae]|uniref:UPF0686 protein C11orf1 homolog n=1 Tax=Latimeria chalumnae TaxID=7897 RepID=UPI00313BD629